MEGQKCSREAEHWGEQTQGRYQQGCPLYNNNKCPMRSRIKVYSRSTKGGKQLDETPVLWENVAKVTYIETQVSQGCAISRENT